MNDVSGVTPIQTKQPSDSRVRMRLGVCTIRAPSRSSRLSGQWRAIQACRQIRDHLSMENLVVTKDLGTYHVRVELKDGRGWIQEWTTGYGFTSGRGGWHPLNAQQIKPTYESDDDVLRGIEYAFTDGNYSCDCNKLLFIGYTEGKSYDDSGERECGDALEIKRLVAIRPDRSEVVLIDEATVSAGDSPK